MSDDEPDTDLPEDDEGMYERLVSHDSAEDSVPSGGDDRQRYFVNLIEERLQQAREREYMETRPRDRIFYFEPPVGEWTLSKFVRSPFYCVITTGVLLVFGIVLGLIVWAHPLLGMILGALSLAPEIYKWVRAKSQARHDQQTPPTP